MELSVPNVTRSPSTAYAAVTFATGKLTEATCCLSPHLPEGGHVSAFPRFMGV